MAIELDINGGFEAGWKHAIQIESKNDVYWMQAAVGEPGIQEYKLPDGWFSIWYGPSRLDLHPHYDGQPHSLFVRPELDLKEEHQLTPEERKGGSDPLIRDGNWTFKPFKGAGAWRAELLRSDELDPGYYRLTAWVRPDPVVDVSGGTKFYATDRASFIYTCCNGESKLIDVTPTDPRVAEWHRLEYTFEAAQPGATVYGVGFYCPWALRNSGFFCDGWTLEHLTDPDKTHDSGARVKYDRVYTLLPQQYAAEWMAAAAEVASEEGKKWTVGYSPDDAGNGCNLGARRILAINPQDVGTGLTQDWFDDWYPGAVMWAIVAANTDEMKKKLREWSHVTEPPTPSPSPPPPEMTKVGFHNQLPFPHYLDLLDRAAAADKPMAVVKIVNSNYEEISEVRRVSPKTLVVGRAVDKDNPDWFLNAPDFYEALDTSNFRHDFYRMVQLGFDVIESPINELIGTNNPEVVKRVVEFEIAYCRWCREKSGGNVAPGVCNPGPGNPQHGITYAGPRFMGPQHGGETSLLVPLAEEVIRQAGYMMPHTYAPVAPQPGLTERWMADEEVAYNYHLRPIFSWLPTFAEHGVDVDKLRFIFGEAGACGAHVNPAGQPGGYRHAGCGWRDEQALDGDLNRYIHAVLVPYEAACQAFPQVVGWCIFTSGRVTWEEFQFNEREYDVLWISLGM